MKRAKCKARRSAGAALLSLTTVSPLAAWSGLAAGQPVQFTDGDFASAAWSHFRYFGGRDAIGGVIVAEQVAAGGAPDAFRLATHIVTGPGDVIAVHLRTGAEYSPWASGPITAIDGRIDASFSPVTDPFWVGCGVALLQGGKLYVHKHSATGPNWTRFESAGLTAEDFRDYYDPAKHPDFSAAGDTIRLGYYTSNEITCTCGRTTALGVDNWTVTVHSTGVTCPADLNGDGIVDFADFLEFLNLFEVQDIRVDFTQDGIVDFGDYLEFLNLYEQGC